MPGHFNVLFLCTGNSARSIMAEAILDTKGGPDFTAYSAGSHPSGAVRPEALRQLEPAGIATAGLRSKSWDEFEEPKAPSFDFVFTVCDSTAKESCPLWPGHPMTAHWGIPDPAVVQGTKEEVENAFREAFLTLDRMARSLSDTFAGRLADAPMFILAQLCVALAATFLFRSLVPNLKTSAENLVVLREG